MVKSNYRYESFKFKSGQRWGVLVDASTGIPLDYENYFITLKHFKQASSINTVKATAYCLRFFADICDFLKIDIEDRFRKGVLLTPSEIEVISYWLSKRTDDLYGRISRESESNVIPFTRRRIETKKYVIVVDENLVEPETAYNRINLIAEYLEWIAEFFGVANTKDIAKMKARLIRHLPHVKFKMSNNSESFKSLEQKDKTALLELVEPESKNNPWKDEGVKFRNKLIVHILMYVGCRKGELLSLKATDIDPSVRLLKIIKNPDDKFDSRKNPALAKTLNRDIEINSELHELIQDYILKYRSKIKGSNKSPYLFLSHQRGIQSGKPLSIEAVDKIFIQISNALGFDCFPHALRHTWNDDFSEKVEEFLNSGDMSESQVEDLRSYLMGWKPDSGTARTYTKRYQQKKALKLGLYLQKKVRNDDKEIIDVLNMDLPF